MMEYSKFFIDDRRLLLGPWQAFERDVARLLLFKGFEDVRIVGGRSDHGADILGARRSELVVVQCKHTTASGPPRGAIEEVVEAGRYYRADRLVVAVSRPPGPSLLAEKARYERTGLKILVAGPALLCKWMKEVPEYAPGRKRLRDYQESASSRLREALIDTGRGQLVLATGLGKTVVMAETVADLLRDGRVPGNKVLILAHTTPLVDQLHRHFWFQLPKWIPTHQLAAGEAPAFDEGITFATIQSVDARVNQMERPGLVIVDEAHHVGAESFRRVIEALNPPMLGGVTATPWRGDGYDIDQLLGTPVARIGIAEGLQRGFLTDVDYRLYGDNVDWKFVQEASRYGYSLSQLNRRLIIPTRDGEAARIVADTFSREKRRSGIIYSPTVLHAEEFAAMLRPFGFRAEAISSAMQGRERDRLMSAFRAGHLDFAATVDLFNEGVDVPDVDMIIFLRTTHSRRIFVQQLGRGLRVSPQKDRVIVLDFVTDLRRVAEVLELDRSVKDGDVEHFGLGDRLVQFTDLSAGSFLREWILDQASLFSREADARLDLVRYDYPEPQPPGGIQ